MEKKTNFHWYILSVRGGREEKMVEKIQFELKSNQLESQVGELKVIKSNNKVLKGLIFCQANLDTKLLQFFYNLPGVIGFLNHVKNSPTLPNFVAPELITRFLQENQTKEKLLKKSEQSLISSDLKVGDWVKVMTGPFTSYEGKVVKINKKTQEISLILESDGRKNLVNNISLDHLPLGNCQKILN